jgi:hypothetical protein
MAHGELDHAGAYTNGVQVPFPSLIEWSPLDRDSGCLVITGSINILDRERGVIRFYTAVRKPPIHLCLESRVLCRSGAYTVQPTEPLCQFAGLDSGTLVIGAVRITYWSAHPDLLA